MTSAALSREQQELATTVQALLDRRADSAAVRRAAEDGYAVEAWRLLTEQIGAPALAIPEDRGGAGFSLFESMIVLEEVGVSLAPVPLLSSIIATELLLALPPTTEAGELLERIANGAVPAVVWPAHELAPLEATIVVDDGGRLTGTVTDVLEGAHAEILLVAASSDVGIGLYLVDPDRAAVVSTPSLDATTRLATIVLDDVPATRLAADAAAALDRAALTAAAGVAVLAAGCARRGLRMTRDYSLERVQFGRPIGSFQAVKHRIADMLVQTETARSVALTAARAVADDSAEAPDLAAAAASHAKEAAHAVAAETIQLHGGIAITWEHDAHMVFKRAHALGQLFGPAHHHRARLLD